jgi:hypothetical protein
MDKQIMIYPQNGIPFSNKKEFSIVEHIMDESPNFYAK